MQNHTFIQNLSRINKRAVYSARKSYSRKTANTLKKEILTDKHIMKLRTCSCSLCRSWEYCLYDGKGTVILVVIRKKTNKTKPGHKIELEFDKGVDSFPHKTLKKSFEDNLFMNTHLNWILAEEAESKWEGVTILRSRKGGERGGIAF